MVDLSAGRVSMPSRVAANVAGRHAMLAAMPAFLPSAGALTTKPGSLFAEDRGRPTHQALICLFDPRSGTPLAGVAGPHVAPAPSAGGARPGPRRVAPGA